MRAVLGFFVGFLVLSAAHAGPVIVGNGGGAGEYSVVFARTNLAEIFRDCGSTACGLDPQEKLDFSRLEAAVPNKPSIVIKTEKEMGTVLFLLQGAEVWINQDLLWLDVKKTDAYGLADAVVLWMKILEAQTGLDPAQFATIEAKALTSLKNYVQRAQMLSTDNQMFEYLLWRKKTPTDVLFLRDPGMIEIDVATAVAAHLKCATVQSLHFFSPALMAGPGGSGPMDDYALYFDFGVRWKCDSSSGNSFGRVVVIAKRTEVGGSLTFENSSVFVHVETGGIQ
ncbi:MAG: hypothetical protein AAB250_14470 [Bdellovibrionota bacterium]